MARLLSEIFQQFSAQLAHFYSPSEIRRLLSYKLARLQKDFPTYPEFPADLPISNHHLAELEHYLHELLRGKPYQYLLGYAPFAGRNFKVSEAVLIPRPETEELFFKIKKQFLHTKPKRIIDFGTGSGCLAISFALEFPQSPVWGIDISATAISIARQNSETLLPAQNNLKFVQADIFQNDLNFPNFSTLSAAAPELWLSNPPYIPLSERPTLAPQVREFEPELALFVPDTNPFLFYFRIVEMFLKFSYPASHLFFEIHAPFAHKLSASLRRQIPANYQIDLQKDLFGENRFLHIFSS